MKHIELAANLRLVSAPLPDVDKREYRLATKLLDALDLWMFNPASTSMTQRLAAAKAMLAISPKLPPELRQSPDSLYRAIVLNKQLQKEFFANVQSGEDILLKFDKRTLSSWTTSYKAALDFLASFGWTPRVLDKRLVLKRDVDPQQVVLNIPVAYKWIRSLVTRDEIKQRFGKRADLIIRWMAKEKEIVIKNKLADLNVSPRDVFSVDGIRFTQVLKGASRTKQNQESEDPKAVLNYIKARLKEVRNTIDVLGGIKARALVIDDVALLNIMTTQVGLSKGQVYLTIFSQLDGFEFVVSLRYNKQNTERVVFKRKGALKRSTVDLLFDAFNTAVQKFK